MNETLRRRAKRDPQIRVALERAFDGELVVDNFAGGGGASAGIEAAIGRPCDLAINHDPVAIRMHQANHPETKHFCESIWEVDPVVACGGRPVGLAHFSPDCRHFSRARGKSKVSKQIRALAWVVIAWARAVRPRVITLENVQEFETWGPTIANAEGELVPDPSRKGETFQIWLSKLRAEGYSIEFQTLNAADYGAPTTRRRLFMVARRDQDFVRFPDATHAPDGKGGLQPWVPAHEIIDWDYPVQSLFAKGRRQLADGTLQRVAKGIDRYVVQDQPFIVRHGHYSKRTGVGLVDGALGAGSFRGQPLTKPLGTLCATNDKNLVVPWIVKNYGGVVGNDMGKTLGTVTSKDSNGLGLAKLARPDDSPDRSRQVYAFLLKYFGTSYAQSLHSPLGTLTTKDRYALVEIHGEPYRIVDIGMRMLQPHELFAAQGFPSNYRIQADDGGKAFTKTEQTRLVGNSVSPAVAEALIRSQTGRAA